MRKLFRKIKESKLVKTIAPTVIDGAAAAVPGGSTVLRVVKNILTWVRGNGEYKHINYIRLAAEVAMLGIVIYAFAKKWIDVEKAIEYLQQFVA